MPVYFIRAGVLGPIKIGHSSNVKRRLQSIRSNPPLPLWVMRVFEGGRPEERMLHERFSHLRLEGEWFKYCDEMAGDVGLKEIEVPVIRRNGPALENPDGWRRASFLHMEIMALCGGAEGIGRAVGEAPWVVSPNERNISEQFWSAAVLMARAAGRLDITMALLAGVQASDAEAARIGALKTAAARDAERAAYAGRLRDGWLARNKGTVPWWTTDEPPRPIAQANAA